MAREDTLDKIEFLGPVAGLLTTFAFLPQAVKTWRTRSADDFSLPTLLMLVVGIGLWTIYGVMRAAPSIWLGNGITMVLAASILSVKLRRAQPSSN
jgi:MtN3 and saliva related transmembrane protein